MKRYGYILLLALIGLWIQSSLFRLVLPLSFPLPNILMVLVIFLAFYDVSPKGTLYAFSVGLLFDLASGVRLGPWAGAFVLVYGGLACGAQRIFIESSFAAVVAVFFGSLAAGGVYLMASLGAQSVDTAVIGRLLIEALLSALLAPFLFPLLKSLLIKRGSGRGRSSGDYLKG